MEYFVFNKEERTLAIRDGFTNQIDRYRLNVISFEIRDGYYFFEFESENKLKYKNAFLPIQNTIIISI